mmetsp:Transcript_34906/g.73640  ORF Transcript_34906/g.73640 Transcript_34906/m.73640 type:complete len:135 (-) Transcript_34906:1152-1556(-)
MKVAMVEIRCLQHSFLSKFAHFLIVFICSLVDELEFIKFMLVAMNKVDGDLFDNLRHNFQQLDVTNSGQITKRDLKIMVTRKMKKVSNKLNLYRYKRKLHRMSSTTAGITDAFVKAYEDGRAETFMTQNGKGRK